MRALPFLPFSGGGSSGATVASQPPAMEGSMAGSMPRGQVGSNHSLLYSRCRRGLTGRICRCCAVILLALAVNLLLFGLMPLLLTKAPQNGDLERVTSPINIVRLKPPEPPVKKVVEKEVKPPPKKLSPPPKNNAPRPVDTRLRLPFDLNTRLPAMATDLSLPVAPLSDLSGLSDIFSAGQLDGPLTMLVRVPPIYPLSARNRGVEGWVKVRFVVNEDGSVSNIEVTEAQPGKIFNQAVIRSVSGWRFKAGTIAGEPVKSWAETVIRFNLD